MRCVSNQLNRDHPIERDSRKTDRVLVRKIARCKTVEYLGRTTMGGMPAVVRANSVPAVTIVARPKAI
jgi:hypothetical protein